MKGIVELVELNTEDVKMKHETIYYLAQMYRANPEKAIEFAHIMALKMRKEGYLIFSPIEYSHHTHKWLVKQRRMVSNKNQRYPITDYVAEDLRLMNTWLNNDDQITLNGDIIRFDSGLVIVMDDNAYEVKNEKIYWFSKGCKDEFNWSIAHNVRIVSLQNFVIDRLIDLPRDLEEELNR